MLRTSVLLTLFLTALFSNQLPESFSFTGLSTAKNQTDFGSLSKIQSQKETLIGVRYGQQTLDWRTMFTLTGGEKIGEFTLEIDKILLDDLFGYPEIRPYLGGMLGYLHYDDNQLTNQDGYYYGGAFGFLFYLTDRIDLDLSYQYKKVKDIDPLNTIKGPSMSIHYFY